MKTLTKQVYYCDHCKKKGLSSFHMINHEKWCAKNPANTNKCSGCIFMEVKEEDFYYSRNNGGEEDEVKIKSTTYFCSVKSQKMHPLLAERKKLPEKYPETFEDSILFPKECEQAKYY